jgi:hypothetical protein
MYQLWAIIIGFVSGISWEELATAPYKNIPTITPSLFVKIAGKNLHIHHWFLYASLLIVFLAIAYKTNRLAHPTALMIFSFLVGAIIYNFIKFPDWYVLFK